MQQVVRGRASRGSDLPAFEILERVNTLIGVGPDLAGCVFKIIDQEHFALPPRREIGQHAPGRQDIEAAANKRLKQLDTGRELARFDPQVLTLPAAELRSKPQPPIHPAPSPISYSPPR